MAISIKTLLEYLEKGSEPERMKAVAVLAKSCDRRAIPYLEQAATHDPSASVRYYARKGIQYILSRTRSAVGGASAAGRSAEEEAPFDPEKALLCLSSPDQWERLKGIRQIMRAGAGEFVDDLVALLKVENNVQVTAALVMAIGKLGDESVTRDLIPFLKHEDPRVRANTIEALDMIGDDSAFVYLIPYLRDEDNRCRANAVLALRRYGRVNVYRTIESMLESDEVWMQDSATYALGRLGNAAEVLRLLEKALSSRYSVVRNQARKVLQRLVARGNERAERLLEKYGSAEEADSEEELFDNVDEIAASAGRSSSPSGGGGAKRRGEILLEELARLSSSGDSSSGASGRDRSEEILERLKSLSSLGGGSRSEPEEEVVSKRSGRRERDPEELSRSLEELGEGGQ